MEWKRWTKESGLMDDDDQGQKIRDDSEAGLRALDRDHRVRQCVDVRHARLWGVILMDDACVLNCYFCQCLV